LLYPICLLLAPEPRAVYGPAEPCFVRSIDLPVAPVVPSVRHT
jgi:hypothetical protein